MPTVKELKEEAKARGLVGFSKLKKAELIELLQPKLKIKKEKLKISIMALPTLYKLTKTGATEYWKIRVENNSIITEYGHLDTENPQTTVDTIKEGKNIGKKNETTPAQQAQAEAQSSWTKKVKKGYVESIDDANQKKVNTEVIKGGVEPILAHKFRDHGDKIKYPAYIQPKLDGIRCVAVIEKGKAVLWSRTRKLINSVPHINKALESLFPNQSLILDGEIYNHDLHNDFEKIVTIVNQKSKPTTDHQIAQYHIYDVVNKDPYHLRLAFLKSLKFKPPLILVHTEVVKNELEVYAFFDKCLKNGYEGAMARNSDGLYIHSRSYDLQKIKEFDDDEFEIVGITEGNGKLTGCVGSFLVKTKEGVVFGAKMDGDTERLREYFENHSLWKGKQLTVRYQGFTKKQNVPRFPVAKAIRETE